jgi:hypothetical protein
MRDDACQRGACVYGYNDVCFAGNDCMVNASLVRRLARADGILLRPDRPLAPLDVMFGGLLGEATVRAMPGLCTPAQERSPNAEKEACGARLWQTHATVFPEVSAKAREKHRPSLRSHIMVSLMNPDHLPRQARDRCEDRNLNPLRFFRAQAPELATAPTRRLVSHGGVDATDQNTVPAALEASAGRSLVQHLVVSVDQPSSFSVRKTPFWSHFILKLTILPRQARDKHRKALKTSGVFVQVQARDLYPPPLPAAAPAAATTAAENNATSAAAAAGATAAVFFRSAADGGKQCVAGADAVASGCVGLVSNVELR